MSKNIPNGRLLKESDKYSLFEVYTANGLRYLLGLPNEEVFDIQVVIDFPEGKSDAEKIVDASGVCDVLYRNRTNYAYLLTEVTTADKNKATEENDDRAYKILFNELCKYTKDASDVIKYTVMAKVMDVVGIVIQTESDQKFVDWLDIEYPNYFKSINLREFKEVDVNTSDDTGWTTLGGPVNSGPSNTLSNAPKAKKLLPPIKASKHGFSNITFSIVVICLALILGIGFVYLLMR